MELSVATTDKNLIEVTLDNVTIAEALRAYLVSTGVDFAAWRRDHPSKPVLFRIQSEKGAVKAVNAAVSALKKDLDALRTAVKK